MDKGDVLEVEGARGHGCFQESSTVWIWGETPEVDDLCSDGSLIIIFSEMEARIQYYRQNDWICAWHTLSVVCLLNEDTHRVLVNVVGMWIWGEMVPLVPEACHDPYCTQGSLNNRRALSHSSGGCKSWIKVLAEMVASKISLLGLRRASSCCVLTWLSLCTHVHRTPVLLDQGPHPNGLILI